MEVRRRIKHSLTHTPIDAFNSALERDPEPYSPTYTDLSLSKRMLNMLTSHHAFTKYSKSGKKTFCEVYFGETLQKMTLEKGCTSYVLTTDIYSAEVDNSPIIKSLVNFNKAYGFRISTKQKLYEFTTGNRIVRDEFVKSLNALIGLSREYMSSMGLKKYCESLVSSLQTDESLRGINKSRIIIRSTQDYQRSLKEELEKEIVRSLINQIINQIEISHRESECNKTKGLISANNIERTKFSYSQENLRNLLALKDQEIKHLKANIKKIETQIDLLRKPCYTPDSSIFSIKIWSTITEYLTSIDIVMLRMTTRTLRNITNKTLSIKPIWRKLCLSSLRPRKVMYRLYIRKFYTTAIRGNVFEVNNDMAEEIHNDVWRGLTDFNKETEEILMQLFKYNPSLSYCQGMHFVAHFLYGVFGNTEEVMQVMDSLLRPPFYLAELWKDGFSRLKLGIFQLEFLLGIRLPFVSKHLKDLDINLDMVVTPLFLTVFTYLQYQQELPRSTVLEIWDFFLLQGWPALISVCLAIFHLTQELILEKSLEQTLMVLTSQIPYNYLSKTIPKFEVDPRLLDDLERSFLCSNL
jgi:Rab-GTPase-TBC domain